MGKLYHIGQLYGVIEQELGARPKYLSVRVGTDFSIDRRRWDSDAGSGLVLFSNVELLQMKKHGAVVSIECDYPDGPSLTVVVGVGGELIALYVSNPEYDAWWLKWLEAPGHE